jgi:hypothetical protein
MLLAALVFVTSLTILVAIGLEVAKDFHSEKRPLREFAPFYGVGRLLNEGHANELYDFDAFLQCLRALFPDSAADLTTPYSHAPFEAVIFMPFALLPYNVAFAVWLVSSLALFCAGTLLVYSISPGIPAGSWPLILPLAISFQPVSIGNLAVGQVAAFSFFWIAVAVYCEAKRWRVASGLALAFCMCKPTLLILIIPMLVVTQRYRILAGLAVGMAALAGASVLVVGSTGSVSYLAMLLRFGQYATATKSPLNSAIYVDASAFFRLLLAGHGQVAVVAAFALVAAVAPFLLRFWRRLRGGDVAMAWSATIIWTTILNLYTPIYDTATVVIAAMLLVDWLRTQVIQEPWRLWVLKGLLYAVYWAPWLGRPRFGEMQVNLYTVALAGLGVYQLYLAHVSVRAVGPARLLQVERGTAS